ncbi:MAG: hypothetical protein CME62_09195 [Halobacteriovoraceae bacterium]|nr:hypothetical protein [Halobacteriovoraceae bacterium]|tara:strand:+ start:16507 stop:17169 length:663 start_codon:yes stop_codon:yes gene_type:complete
MFLDEFIQKLNPNEKKYYRNDLIVSKDRKEKKVYVIKSGVVKVTDLKNDKQDQTILILNKGECFPLIWAFDHPGATTYNYEALSDCEVLSTHLSHFKNKMSEDANFTKISLEMFVNISWDLMERIRDLQMNYTTEKLLRALPYIAAKTGEKLSQNTFKIPDFMTQMEIARLLGTSRESISTHLKKKELSKAFRVQDTERLIDLANIDNNYIFDRWFKKRV